MDILANIKSFGEQRLYLVPAPKEPESIFHLILSQEDYESPKATLHLKEPGKGRYEFLLEDDNDLVFYEQQEKEAFQEQLNVLASKVKSAIDHGEDIAAIDIPEHAGKMNPYDPELIDIRDTTLSVFQAYLMIQEGDINLSPDFQRNEVWDAKRKSRLIESLLLRIPLPVFYFSQGKNGKLSVVDGLQRLTAIKQFMNNDLKLSELEYLTDLNGLSYSDIQQNFDLYVRRLKITKLSANIIQPGSPTKVRYDIFRRLNTGSRPLNNQELRNCMASPALRTALKNMAGSEEFVNATGNSVDDMRMEAQEMVLRFMRFWDWMTRLNSIADYKGDMDNTLDEFTEEVSLQNNFPFAQCEEAFKNAMRNALYLFGRHSFRKVFRGYNDYSKRLPINKAVFLAFSVVLSSKDHTSLVQNNEPSSWIGKLADEIDSDSQESMEIMKLISYGTNGAKNIKAIFGLAEKLASSLT